MNRGTGGSIFLYQTCGKASVRGHQRGFGRDRETCLAQPFEHKKSCFLKMMLNARDWPNNALYKIVHPLPCLNHGVSGVGGF